MHAYATGPFALTAQRDCWLQYSLMFMNQCKTLPILWLLSSIVISSARHIHEDPGIIMKDQSRIVLDIEASLESASEHTCVNICVQIPCQSCNRDNIFQHVKYLAQVNTSTSYSKASQWVKRCAETLCCNAGL